MTQHIFTTKNFSITCGWDRPLQGFFLTIEDITEVKKGTLSEGELIFSNLDLHRSHPPTFEPFLDALYGFNISLPCGLLDALKADKENNIGNKMTIWDN